MTSLLPGAILAAMISPALRLAWRSARAILPWLVGIALLAYLLAPYAKPEARAILGAAFSRAPGWAPIIPIVGALLAFAADTLATWLVLRWGSLHLPFRFAQVAVIRGVTYFLAIVNYNLGQAAMVYVLVRAGMRAARATGLMLFIMGINMLVLLLCAGLSVAFGAPAHPLLRGIFIAVGLALPLYALALRLQPRGLARIELFAPLFDLGISGHLRAALARLPHVVCMLLAQWAMMRAFGIETPAGAAALYLPIVFVVAVLPISAQGLGTSQLVLIQCFARYAPGTAEEQKALILAYSLYMLAIWIPTQIAIGSVCLRTPYGRALRDALRGGSLPTPDPSPAMAEEAAP